MLIFDGEAEKGLDPHIFGYIHHILQLQEHFLHEGRCLYVQLHP